MKSASVYLYKETLSKNVQVPARKSAGYRQVFSLAPGDVWAMTAITPAAKIVLVGLAMHGKGEAVLGFSHGFIAGVCGLKRSTVAAALDSLEDAGLVRKSGGMKSQVQPYEMLHPMLVRKLRAASAEDVSVVRRDGPVLVKCLRCPKKCRPNKAGWCRKCQKDVEMDSRIDRRIDRALVAKSA